MIGVAFVAGLAGVWLWAVLNDDEGMFWPVPRFLNRWHWTEKWLRCPFCSGAWFSIIATVAVYRPSIAETIVTALAAAAVCGTLGATVLGD